ncbi:MAG TPA: MgtC/SapB family protein [Candidatus Parcubacteria bacterium]|nr:MgtC/SapB family protein [Candidatus Parcubacteria bacterium]
MEFFNDPQMVIVLKLLLAAFLGGLIGIERKYKKKEAGLRTYSLVCLGAAFFTIISYETIRLFPNSTILNFDPSRIIGQLVLGIGFLGAGLIIFRGSHIEGLTTAAGLWVATAVGAAIGIGFYALAFFAAFLIIGILSGLRIIEERYLEKGQE